MGLTPLVLYEPQNENRIEVPEYLPLTDSLVRKTQWLLNRRKLDPGGLILAEPGALHIHTARALLLRIMRLLPSASASHAPFEANRLADVFQ